MTMNQKKALYAFGSPDREATVNRFCTLAELAPDPAVKHFFLAIARELNAPTADRWYRCMFFNLRLEMEAYLRYEKAFERIKPDKQTFDRMMDAISAQKRSRQWTENNGQYIPNPATWLNQRRWEDELPQGETDNVFLQMLREEGEHDPI